MRKIQLFYVFLLLMLFALSCNASEKITKTRTGVLSGVEPDMLQFVTFDNMRLSIGFICDPIVCKSVSRFSVGDNVIAKFGVENRKNKLISVRKFVDNDLECEHVAEAMKAEEMAEVEKRRNPQPKKSFRAQQMCYRRMQATLLEDNRYIINEGKYSSEIVLRKIISEYNSLRTDYAVRECMDKIISDHKSSVMESCDVHNCGESIGGECSDMAEDSFSINVVAKAVSECGT